VKHHMDYVGMSEWICPTCGRHIKFMGRKMIVMVSGDQDAIHSGSSINGLSIDVEITQNDPDYEKWLREA